MSLIPFILDLADELQEYQRCLIGGGVGGGIGIGCSAMDIDDVDFGLQSLHEAGTQNTAQHQQQQQLQQQSPQQQNEQQRRPRLLSQLYWPSNILQKQQQHHHHQHHHHHARHHPYAQTARLCCSAKDRDSAAIKANSIAGLANKPTVYPVINKNGWMMVSMNVKQFTPDELIVKTIDNCIIVEGRHEDKEDIHGVISRHFIRKYMLPKGYDPNEVVSTLSSDGILTVKAPPPAPPKTDEEATERIVDIQQTGPAQMAVKQTTPPPPAAAAAAAAAEASLEQPNSPKDITPEPPATAEQNIAEGEAPLEQATQLEEEEEAMQIEHSIEMHPMLEATADEQVTKDEEKCDVDIDVDVTATATSTSTSTATAVAVAVDVISEDVSSVDVNVAAKAATAAVEKLELAVNVAAEILAESAKPEMQADIIAPETSETAELVVNSSAASADVPMTASDEPTDDVADVAAATNNGGGVDDDKVKDTDCSTSTDNAAELSANNTKEKNGLDAANIVGDAAAAAAEAPVPVIKTTIVLPAEVPASLDLGVCVPKSVVIDAASPVKETANTDAETVDEKNGLEANGTNGGDVDDNGVVIGVAAIDSLPAAAEELVAN